MTRYTLISIAVGFALVACSKSAPAADTTSAAAPQADSLASDKQPAGHPPVGGPTPHLPEQPVRVTDGEPHAGGLTWQASKLLESQPPASPMRAAEYKVAGEGPDMDAILTVYYFGAGQGGSVQNNLDRWIGQFSQPDGKSSQEAASITKVKSGDIPITKLDLKGNYSGGMAPMMGQSPKPQEDQRLLGAIAEGPEGLVFFKLTGPSQTVARAQGAFDDLVASIKPR